MRPNFSREGCVAGYLGQCPKFDRILFWKASLRSHMGEQLFKIPTLCQPENCMVGGGGTAFMWVWNAFYLFT